MPRCLILVTTRSYRTDAFLAAARELGVEVVLGSDRCGSLAKLWPDEAFTELHRGLVERAVQVDLRRPERGARQIERAAVDRPLDAIVATDDATAVVAALASARLGLPGNAPDAAIAARDKAEMRRRLHAAGVPAPPFIVVEHDAPLPAVVAGMRAAGVSFPVVAKPLRMSASRGVVRANDDGELGAAIARITPILRSRPEMGDGVPEAGRILIESFVPGVEVALEGIVRDGALRTLAIFDKPDPLDGPCFEETLLVTPSRLPEATQRAIADTTARAAAAMGLREGPIHAEVRVGERGPVMIEVAARSIGGLCARTLRFVLGGPAERGAGVSSTGSPAGATPDHALEEIVLRHALGLPTDALTGEGGAAGVLMLPVPGAGVLQSVAGVEAALAVPLVEDVVVTARVGERLVPLPEGSSYPGFVFARGETPAAVESALRAAWKHLRLVVAPTLS